MKKLFLVFSIISCFSCYRDSDSIGLLPEKGEEFSGGEATVNDLSENAFGHAAPNLIGDKDLFFVTGNSFFKTNWVTAPSSTVDFDGLGPLFNARSCSSCHFKDGRAAPPLSGEQPVGLLFKLSKPTIEWGPIPDELYGSQFHTQALLGVQEEGNVSIVYDEVAGSYPDGTSYSLRNPTYSFTDLNYGSMADDIQVSPRIGPQMVGLGLLEAISEQDLIVLSDEFDSNNDGISGKLNYVKNEETGNTEMGRFGWKAGQPTVRQQVAGAFINDLGITSSIFPDEQCTSGQEDCQNAQNGGEPELTAKILDRVTLYSAALAVPARRNWDNQEVLSGKRLFNEIGCSYCHIPKIVTSTSSAFAEFENQTIRPYTDLLLHDMGEGLSDGRPEALANGQEWRTPPLWGIGMIEVVNDHTFFLHDGRARNLEEAILWHGGEAEQAKESFKHLTKSQREILIKFLESL